MSIIEHDHLQNLYLLIIFMVLLFIIVLEMCNKTNIEKILTYFENNKKNKNNDLDTGNDVLIIEKESSIIKELLENNKHTINFINENNTDVDVHMFVYKYMKTDTELLHEIKITNNSGNILILEQYSINEQDLIIRRIIELCEKYKFVIN